MTITPNDVYIAITTATPPDWEVRAICDEEWLATHPGGFAPLSAIADDETEDPDQALFICPERIAALAEDLSAEQALEWTQAIADFIFSTGSVCVAAESVEEVVGTFLLKAPDAALFMVGMAERRGIPLVDFLAIES